MQWLSRNSFTIALTAILFSASMAIGIAIHAGNRLVYQDEKDYITLSSHLVKLHLFSLDGRNPTASRAPGYVWFLTLPQFFGASVTATRMFNVAGLTISQVLLFLLARRIGSEATAAIAVLLSAGYPVLFYSATVLFPQTLGAALLLCGLWFVFSAGPIKFSRAFLAGMAWGALILTIPTFLIPVVAVSAWLLCRSKNFRRAALPFATALVVMPGLWMLRNYIVFKAPVFIATNGGVNLLLGNSENVTPAIGSSADISKYTKIGHQLAELEQNRYYTDSAKKWITEHPKEALRLYREKLLHYFSFADRTEANDQSTPFSDRRQSWREVIMALTYGPLLLLFVSRLATSVKYALSQEESCLLVLFVANALIMAVFFTRIRFRLPTDWLMLLMDAVVVSSIASGLSSRAWLVGRNQRRMKRLAEAESAALRSARMRLSAMHTLGQQ